MPNLEIYTAKVVEFFPKTWIIKFEIPGVMTNLEEYPEAFPIMNHVYDVEVGSEVIIFRPDESNSTFFYVQSNIYEFVGIKYLSNIIDCTKDKYINISTKENITASTKEIDLLASLLLKLVCGGASIQLSKDGNITIVGNIGLTGNINMNGELLATGLIGSNLGFNGRIYDASGKSRSVVNGLILER